MLHGGYTWSLCVGFEACRAQDEDSVDDTSGCAQVVLLCALGHPFADLSLGVDEADGHIWSPFIPVNGFCRLAHHACCRSSVCHHVAGMGKVCCPSPRCT